MLQEKERVVVITRYKAIYPTEVSVWLREGWDVLTDDEKATRELVMVGTHKDCHAVADVIRSNLELNRKGEIR